MFEVMSSSEKTCLCHFCERSGTGNNSGRREHVSEVSSSMLGRFQENRRSTPYFPSKSTNYERRFEGLRSAFGYHPKFGSSQDQGILWQFSGRSGNWHDFRQQGSCSVSSADIEAKYRHNPYGSMDFIANGDRDDSNQPENRSHSLRQTFGVVM